MPRFTVSLGFRILMVFSLKIWFAYDVSIQGSAWIQTVLMVVNSKTLEGGLLEVYKTSTDHSSKK